MPEAAQFTKIDLLNPETVFVNRLPDMTVVQERLFRHFKTLLFQEFRRNVDSTDDVFHIVSHDEYLSHRGGCNLYGIMNIAPIKGLSLVTIDGHLLAAVVDDIFGADAPAPLDSGRNELSRMENRIGKRLMNMMVASVSTAFQQYFEVSAEIVRTEGFSALASVGDAAEPFCAMSTKLSLPTGAGTLSIAMPYRGLEPFREILGSPMGGRGQQDASSLWADRIEAAVDNVPIEIAFEIGTVSLPARNLATLAVGDVLPLTFHRNARAMIGGTSIAEIRYGAVDLNYGVYFSK